jgi:gamma-glutamyl phosphate reductase
VSDEKEKQIEQLLSIVKQQNSQIECLTDLCKNGNNVIKDISKSHDKSFTSAFIASLISIVMVITIVIAIVFIYENQFTYSSSTTSVSAEGTEANAQYVGGNYNGNTEKPKGSEK